MNSHFGRAKDKILERNFSCQFCQEGVAVDIFERSLVCERCREIAQKVREECATLPQMNAANLPPIRPLEELESIHDMLKQIHADADLRRKLDLTEAIEVDIPTVVQTLCWVLNHDVGYGKVGHLIKGITFYFLYQEAELGDLKPKPEKGKDPTKKRKPALPSPVSAEHPSLFEEGA